nr:hypothetical protein [uncultured Methanobrevibacter sp.]
MSRTETYHINDKTMKYMNFAQSRRKHQYLGLPGNFKSRVPQEMIFTDMTSARADELYYNDENLLIDLEEESDYISTKTLEKFSKYSIFNSYWHIKRKLYLAVICHKTPKNRTECFEYAPSVYIHVHYIHLKQDELWKKYENVINKVKHKETLTDTEALDIAFTSKFISKRHAPSVVEKLCEAFKDAKIEDKHLKLDVRVILSGMILKHIKSEIKQNRLMEMIGMRNIENELDELVYEQYGDKLDAKDKEIENKNTIIKNNEKEIKTKDNTIEKYAKLIKKLQAFDDFNTPEARKIINALILLK